MADRGITYMKGDWTNEDQEIFCSERFNQPSVPLYVLYQDKKRARHPASNSHAGNNRRDNRIDLLVGFSGILKKKGAGSQSHRSGLRTAADLTTAEEESRSAQAVPARDVVPPAVMICGLDQFRPCGCPWAVCMNLKSPDLPVGTCR